MVIEKSMGDNWDMNKRTLIICSDKVSYFNLKMAI